MAEINEFLSPKAQKQIDEYLKSLDQMNQEYTDIAKTLDTLNKKTRSASKNEKDLDTVTKEGNKLLAQRDSLIAKQSKQLQPLTKELIKQKEAVKEQNKQLREQAKADLGIKKRSRLFGEVTKSIIASLTVMGAVTGALKLIWKEISRTQEFQLKWNIGLKASRAAMDVLTGSIKNASKGGFKDFNKRLDDAIERTIELTKQFQILSTQQIAITKKANDLRMIEELYKSVADDATLSFQDREMANEKATEAAIKRANIELDLNKELFENYKAETEEKSKTGLLLSNEELQRLATYRTAYDQSRIELKRIDLANNKFKRELALDDFEQELDFIFDVGDKRKTANEKEIADTRKTQEERQAILNSTNTLLDESFKDQIDLFESFHNLQIDTNKLLNLNNKESFEYARGLGLSERATNRLLEVIRERIAATSDLSEAQKTLRDLDDTKAIEVKEKVEKSKYDIVKDNLDKTIQANKEANDQIEADDLESIETRKQINEALNQAIADGGNALFDLKQSQLQREIDAEEDGSKRQKQLMRELAVSERNQALFSVALNTARGITAALTSTPPNVPLSVVVGAIGAVQAGAILSQPLPAFFAGTDNAPSTFIAGDKYGRELIAKKDGSVELSPDQATIYSGNEYKGASIIPNSQTENILRGGGNGYDNSRLERKLDKVVWAIEKSKSNINISRNAGRLNVKHLNRKYGIN